MKIHNKLFLVLFSFSLLLVAVLVLLIQWSIRKGMIEYVNNKETEALKPLIVDLENEYKKENNWKQLKGRDRKFGNLVYSNLKDTAFLPPPPMKPNNQFRIPFESRLKRENDASLRSGPPDLNLRRRPEFRPKLGNKELAEPEVGTPSNSKRRANSGPPEARNSVKNNPDIEPNSREEPFEPFDFSGEVHASYVLLDRNSDVVVGQYLKEIKYNKIVIIVEEINVGWLAIPKRDKVTDGFELDFLEKQQNYLWIIAFVVMILVALIALLLARHIAEPIKLIMQGMHKLTQGDYEQQLDLKRKDELGELGRDFNELAITLHGNEDARKRWLANISHELRTPVAILRGELEAMLDGVRALDKSNIDSANDEVKHLQRLIDDLHQLTSADIGGMHYRKKSINFNSWLNSEENKYRSYLANANISFAVEVNNTSAFIFADTTRLCQLFDNLINNSIKYSEASLVKISLKTDESSASPMITVKVEDDGVGVAEQHLPRLFEHLYRVEDSRNRKTGGSGLGLSISAHIVAAHHGQISAQQSKLGGLAIIIELPISK